MTSRLSNSKTPKKRRAWPEKRRREQAKRCRQTKPWEKSTGPTTPVGKAKMATNPYKHGFRSADMQEIRALLRAQRDFVKAITATPQ